VDHASPIHRVTIHRVAIHRSGVTVDPKKRHSPRAWAAPAGREQLFEGVDCIASVGLRLRL